MGRSTPKRRQLRPDARQSRSANIWFKNQIHHTRIPGRAVSPFHRVGRPTIPFLLIHGDVEKVVPLAQSQKLIAAIKGAGGSAELVIKAGGRHAVDCAERFH